MVLNKVKIDDVVGHNGLAFYAETSPMSGKEYMYFDTSRGPTGQLIPPSVIGACTVFYNEEGYTMEKTLQSLRLQQGSSKWTCDLLLVGDGLEHMSTTMATFLQQIFHLVTLPVQYLRWPDWANTCIVNMPPDDTFWPHGKICLVLKKHNKGKWNSHEWHMKSFANASRYCFLTDVGCQYDTGLLSKFLHHLKLHPTCVGVTARRISQSQHQQADPALESHEDGFLEGMLRAIQSHVYEAENNSRIENIFGCIPILCGNCTFIDWARAKQSSFVQLYFRLSYKSPSEVGFFMGQLRIAEDSVQAAYLLTHVPNASTQVVENAYSYIDVELSWDKFAKQRRRWYNSNFACAKYLLMGANGHPHTVWGSNLSLVKKVALSLCMIKWMLTLVAAKVAVGTYAWVFFQCNIALLIGFMEKDRAETVSLAIMGLYLLTYVGYVYTHLKSFGPEDCSFQPVIWCIASLVNVVQMLATIVLVGLSFGTNKLPQHSNDMAKSVLYFNLIAIALPWFRTCYMDPKRVANVLMNIVSVFQIIAMSSMVNGFMHAYYMARSMDLSWGNRPSQDLKVNTFADKSLKGKVCDFKNCVALVSGKITHLCPDHNWMKKNVATWKLVNGIVVCINIGIPLVMIWFKYNTILALAVIFGMEIGSIVMTIAWDVVQFVRNCMLGVLCLCQSHKKYQRLGESDYYSA